MQILYSIIDINLIMGDMEKLSNKHYINEIFSKTATCL